ncbi:MAG: hypothetical protein DMF69_24120, partial [Acidobacteria bacterium]
NFGSVSLLLLSLVISVLIALILECLAMKIVSLLSASDKIPHNNPCAIRLTKFPDENAGRASEHSVKSRAVTLCDWFHNSESKLIKTLLSRKRRRLKNSL